MYFNYITHNSSHRPDAIETVRRETKESDRWNESFHTMKVASRKEELLIAEHYDRRESDFGTSAHYLYEVTVTLPAQSALFAFTVDKDGKGRHLTGGETPIENSLISFFATEALNQSDEAITEALFKALWLRKYVFSVAVGRSYSPSSEKELPAEPFFLPLAEWLGLSEHEAHLVFFHRFKRITDDEYQGMIEKKMEEYQVDLKALKAYGQSVLETLGIGFVDKVVFSFEGNPTLSGVPDTLTEAVIEVGFEKLADEAFLNRTRLETVSIPDSVKTLGYNLFKGCLSLKAITLPPAVMHLPLSCFAGCSSLREVILPKGLVEMEASAFEGCEALEEIVLPSTLKHIGFSVFCGCKHLKKVTLPTGLIFDYYDADDDRWYEHKVRDKKDLAFFKKEIFEGCPDELEMILI